ncbi:hydroxymethylbilane synthase [Bacillaceae bacterium]
MKTIIVGSRQSALALTQTQWVIERLQSLGLSYRFEVKKIVTKGDRILDVTLSKVGGKGLFVKEIEQALLNGEIDFAVHSMKDLPARMPEGLTLAAVTRRVDARDVLLSPSGATLDRLPPGAVIGTSSLRRAAQLKAYRPDFVIEPLRGNIDTRIRKLREGRFDAIVLAAAGLERMNWQGEVTQYLPVEISVPAVGQGALGIQCRADDRELCALLMHLNHEPTRMAVAAERAFLHRLDGGCQVPIGAYGEADLQRPDNRVRLVGLVASPDGRTVLKATRTGDDPVQLGVSLAEELERRGAGKILQEAGEDQ